MCKLLLSILLFLTTDICTAENLQPVDYVSTLVGTESKYSLSNGNTYPAIAMPWGMNFWTPQTGRNGDGWQYSYQADKILGFKQTHQPSPWINDYGAFSIMPITGNASLDDEKRGSWFSHKTEIARPYYYKVYLADYDIVVEIAPTEHAAMFRITYPQADKASIIVDAVMGKARIQQIADNIITGYDTNNHGGVTDNFKNYFIIESSKSFNGNSQSGNPDAANTDKEKALKMAFNFKTQRGEQVILKVASSFISDVQARQNLKELDGKSFDDICSEGRTKWNDVLGRIEIKDKSNTDHLRTFYSCLYRSLLFPRALWETDAKGNILHYSPYNGKVEAGYMYTDTGFWDTFRSLFPLLNLVYPDVNAKIQAGLVNAYKESGFLPEWASPGHRDCMVGNNSASVVADAYIKGIRGYDIKTLWKALVHDANAVHPTVSSTGRSGWELYNKLGYVPYDVKINENVARTLEYAYDDWCIWQLGKAIGIPEKELKIYAKRAHNYRNVFDKTVNLMRGKNKDGKFQKPFNPLKWGDAFTEGNSWHYTWSVFHDPQGLINLMGGDDTFNTMMDSVFNLPPVFDDSYYGQVIHEIREMQIMNMGNYAHGNQPIQHMIYLYGYSGQPWKAQYRIRQVMDRMYTANPDGYCGDEDNGQTSAWYVFSALGFYPVCPGSNQYAIGTPYFNDITLHLNGDKTLNITTEGNGEYIDGMTLNGITYSKNYLNHNELMNGGNIHFRMSTSPNRQRGTKITDRPYSMSKPK